MSQLRLLIILLCISLLNHILPYHNIKHILNNPLVCKKNTLANHALKGFNCYTCKIEILSRYN